MRKQKLMRVWYPTDVDPGEPEYAGAFSDPFPAEDPTRRIVAVDWSNRGVVVVTWLVAAL